MSGELEETEGKLKRKKKCIDSVCFFDETYSFLIIDFRERRKEGEKHQFVAPLIYAFICCFLCVPDQRWNP